MFKKREDDAQPSVRITYTVEANLFTADKK
jgi:hypothetical protein